MKKTLFSLLTACSLFLVGCLETTQEVTINEDGSGTVSYTNDMSAVIGLMKQMGNAEDMKGADQVIDSTISLEKMADSVQDLSDEEKAMMKSGVMQVNMDLKNEKFLTKLNFPFKSTTSIPVCDQLSGKMIGEAMKGQAMLGGTAEGEGGSPRISGFEDYFKTVYSNGKIEKTLIKEKYEKAGEDEMMSSMKEGAAMGLGMKANYIINLPRPATKAEGKGITLSEDKKKVTITVDMDDFFDEPAKFEFLIEY
jgi:hypothetical protein